jgi:hypothetical protein
MLVTVGMLMTKKEEGMKLTATMLPTATAMLTLDMTFVVMMTLDIFILHMILAMVTVNSATLILATSIAIITCHIHYITTLATHILNMSFLILMITVVMYAVDMGMKKQAMGMAMLVFKVWTPMKSFLKRRWQWLWQQDMWWSALLISSNSFYM